MTDNLEQSTTSTTQDFPTQWRAMSLRGKLTVGAIVIGSFAGAGALIYDLTGAAFGAGYGLFCALGTELNSRSQR